MPATNRSVYAIALWIIFAVHLLTNEGFRHIFEITNVLIQQDDPHTRKCSETLAPGCHTTRGFFHGYFRLASNDPYLTKYGYF